MVTEHMDVIPGKHEIKGGMTQGCKTLLNPSLVWTQIFCLLDFAWSWSVKTNMAGKPRSLYHPLQLGEVALRCYQGLYSVPAELMNGASLLSKDKARVLGVFFLSELFKSICVVVCFRFCFCFKDLIYGAPSCNQSNPSFNL